MRTRAPQAFTLIELAVVLVIIGLVAGGVLVGRDLIANAAIRKQIRHFEEIKTAHYAFKVKYNCIAGDCPTITQFISGTASGNGNGLVENDGSGCTGGADNCLNAANWKFTGEQARYFEQLTLGKFLAGRYVYNSTTPGVGYPVTTLNGDKGGIVVARDRLTLGDGPCTSWARGLLYSYDCMGFGDFTLAAFAIIGEPGASSFRNSSNGTGIFTPLQTLRMDDKLDDGRPFTGVFRGANGGSAHTTTPNGYCATGMTAGSAYNLANPDTACHTAFKLE